MIGSQGCKDPDDEKGEEGATDADADSANARRIAMYEWYHETLPDSPSAELWSREYMAHVMRAATVERTNWRSSFGGGPSVVSGTQWSNIGPTRANVEQNGSTSLNVSDSGRMRTIIPDGSTIYLATAGGGVWRTTDGGGTWTPLSEALGSLSCGSLAMDPSNHSTLYLGLGDPFDGTGLGIVKTVDGGNTWSDPIFLGDSTKIEQVVVDPAATNVVLVATNKGLYRSADSGTTFSPVAIATGGTEAAKVWTIASTGGHGFALSLEAAPSQTMGTTDGQVWTSTDDGASWTKATGMTKTSGVGRITLGAAPSNGQIVYAMAAVPNATSSSDLADIFKSTNGGATWTALNATTKTYTNSNAESSTVGTLLNQQGWYNGVVLVDPSNPNTVYFGGALLLVKTTDGGTSFTQLSNWLAQFGLPYVHADFHAAAFDASNGRLYIGTDGGVFMSSNNGATFTDTLNVGLTTHLLYSVGSSTAAPNAVIGGFQDNGTRVRSGTTSTFDQFIGGDGFGSMIHPTNAQQMIGSLYYDRIFKSTNGGTVFSAASSGITESNNSSTAPFITRIVPWEGSTTGNDVLTFSNFKVYRTTNFAGSWTATAAAPVSTGAIRNVGIAKSNANIIGVVASGGRVFLTNNGGTSWTQAAAGADPTPGSLPGGQLSLSDVRFDPTNPNTVYVASVAPIGTAAHLWKSLDFGATWARIDTNGLPAGIPVNILRIDPSQTQTLFAGTHLGVYRSQDGGASWARFGNGMPLVSVTDLYISPDTTLVRAATYGRGFWDLRPGTVNDFSISANPTSVSAQQGASAQANIVTAVTSGSPETVALSASGLPAGASASFSPSSITSGSSAVLTLTAGAATPAGTYSITVTGAAASATHTTNVSFTVTTVVVDDFSIAANPPSVSAAQGASGTTSITTAVTSGNAQSVALSIAGLPAGASATFNPSSVTAGGSSTLTLVAGAATAAGTYSLTVTGTGATATHATTVSFTVTAVVANDFSIAASPATVSAAQGGSGTSTISTAVTSGSAQSVALSASGLPSGATASFSPASVTAGGSSTLTLTAGVATAAGSYAITVTGTGASATHTTTVTFNVTTGGTTVLTSGVPVTGLSGAKNAQRNFLITVPAGQTLLSVTISGGTGDADLYVRQGTAPTLSTFDCRPFISGNNETCTFNNPAATNWFIMLNGFTAYTGVTLTATFSATPDTTPALTNGVPVTGLSGAQSSQQFFKLTVPAGQTKVVFQISGGTGDADLYVRRGSKPTTTTFDCRPFISGNNETCTINNPVAADYFVMIRGFTAFSGVTLVGHFP